MTGKVLLLIGGGHAHLQVITAPLPTSTTTRILISEATTAIYSGMLPAVIAGITPPSRAEINLPTLCKANSTTFIHARVTKILPDSNTILFQPNHTSIECTLSYDYLSINIGSTTRAIQPLQQPHTTLPIVIPTRPIVNLDPAVQTFQKQAHSTQPVVVIGAGAAGVELALALSTRLPTHPITLISRADAIASQFGRKPASIVTAELRRRQIRLLLGRTVISISRTSHTITLDNAETVPFELAVIATGAAPHQWLMNTGLSTDSDGWLLADPTLKCDGFDNIFAAGDCVSFGPHFKPYFPPKAGVYAVRQGPILVHNLAVAVRNTGKLKLFNPQASFLSLLSTGDGRAIGSKYGIAFRGAWVYRLKSFIDESWQDRFRVSAEKPKPVHGAAMDSIFTGSPVEGAAILHVADEIRVDDSFEQQFMVLRRMDADEVFRNELVKISNEHASYESSP